MMTRSGQHFGRASEAIWENKMRIRFIFLVVLLTVFFSPHKSFADQSGITTTFVASTGSDTNNCIPSDPCRTLAGALAKVETGGTIVCLSTPQDFEFEITVSVTVECNQAIYPAITINLPASDTKQFVHLRGMTLNSAGEANIILTINAAGTVVLDDMIIEGSTAAAVKDMRQSPGKLVVKNTIFGENGGPGIVVAGAPGNVAVFEGVTASSNAYGVAVAAGNRVSIVRSSFSGNSIAGVEADGGSFVTVDGSTISSNNVGIQSGSAIRLSNNDITFNTTAVNGPTGTFGNNRFSGNMSDGTALTPVGASSTDLAQK